MCGISIFGGVIIAIRICHDTTSVSRYSIRYDISCHHYKYDGYAGLSTDYIINACNDLYVRIMLLFSAMIVHGIVFDNLLVSSIIPIGKGKNINCTESANYRGIALSSILGKLTDKIILSRYADKLTASQYQFGFKKAHSTTIRTMVVKETINYYTLDKSHTYSTFLQCHLVFDEEKYCKLFRCLIDRKLPSVVLRLLYISCSCTLVMLHEWFGMEFSLDGLIVLSAFPITFSPIPSRPSMDGKTTQSVHCTISGLCLRMHHRPSACRVYSSPVDNQTA